MPPPDIDRQGSLRGWKDGAERTLTNSVVEIEDGGWVMAIQFMAPVARLDAVRAEITTALDMVFQGF